jgi:alkanesulfonate monooxygenase SsuD/methylene tetrahydromethanopterin reductase-like flavin-dependent oxidoreductase (luciferase family)
MPQAASDVESLVELLRAVADALDPGAMVAAHPDADPSLLLALVTERAGTVAGAIRGLLEHPTDLGRQARMLAQFLHDLQELSAPP